MNCEYFGKCGSCSLYEMTYEEQLTYKINREKDRFKEFYSKDFEIIKSEPSKFRNRAEFKIWKKYDKKEISALSYAMTSFEKQVLPISSCEIVNENIYLLMPKLLKEIEKNEILSFKFFACEFLASTKNSILVTLIYHKKLDDRWIEEAKKIENKLKIKIIGRSKGQKIVLSNDYINETLNINNKDFFFEYKEGGFTQPNTKVNIQMIEWVLKHLKKSCTDLCELYCGGGNFTIPLSTKFRKTLATEISKTSIKSALKNCELNNINSIDFIRMSAEEFVEACENKREFNRLKNIDLKNFNFSTIFVDPPRAGLDETTRKLVKNYDRIIYISCNPETLYRDLTELSKTHQIEKFALFDQFAYTNHCECGVILNKI